MWNIVVANLIAHGPKRLDPKEVFFFFRVSQPPRGNPADWESFSTDPVRWLPTHVFGKLWQWMNSWTLIVKDIRVVIFLGRLYIFMTIPSTPQHHHWCFDIWTLWSQLSQYLDVIAASNEHVTCERAGFVYYPKWRSKPWFQLSPKLPTFLGSEVQIPL